MATTRDPIYAGYRYPAEIISYAVWLDFRFPLSVRMVEEMLAARGISVTHETIRQWGLKFGREFANRIRQRAPCRGDKWHLDEVVISIAGKKHWLWRAVDQDGFVLDVLVQSRRDKKAAKRLCRKLLKKQGRAPRVLVTDKLKSYAAAKREIMPGGEHRQHKGLNHRHRRPGISQYWTSGKYVLISSPEPSARKVSVPRQRRTMLARNSICACVKSRCARSICRKIRRASMNSTSSPRAVAAFALSKN